MCVRTAVRQLQRGRDAYTSTCAQRPWSALSRAVVAASSPCLHLAVPKRCCSSWVSLLLWLLLLLLTPCTLARAARRGVLALAARPARHPHLLRLAARSQVAACLPGVSAPPAAFRAAALTETMPPADVREHDE